MFKEYKEFYTKYTQKYGENTAIFLMVGSFYELYDIQHIETGETACNIKNIVDILGIQLSSKKNNEIEDGYTGLFAGFPDYVMHKWAGRLTSAGWTVVIVNQIKDIHGKVKERSVSRILSPSTHIENTSSTETPYIITLYFNHPRESDVPQYGVGVLDLTTGTTHSYYGTASGRSDIWTADDIVQMISIFQPKEIVVYWKNQYQSTTPDASNIKRILGITQQQIKIHIRTLDSNGSFEYELVRSEYLQKIYSVKSLIPVKTYLGLRSELEELALVFLLQFVEEHYPSILTAFHRNEPWIPEMRLICGNHTLKQLQMISSSDERTESVVGLFNKTLTAMGKRAIRERLLSPYSDSNEIRGRLHEVQEYITLLETEKNNTKLMERQLRFIQDIPRLHRKIQCGYISSQEMSGLFQSYSAIQCIMNQCTKHTLLEQPYTDEQWDTYRQSVKKHFNEDKMLQSNQNLSGFNTETYPDIHTTEESIKKVIESIEELRKIIAVNGNVSEDSIRLEEREKEPFGFKASSVTIQQLKKNQSVITIKLSELKSGGWIDCIELQQFNTQLLKHRELLERQQRIHMVEACSEISDAGKYIWTLMEQWVSHIDCTQCIAHISMERGYVCPTILDTDSKEDTGSSFSIKQIRHPLVESLSSRVSYVKHDVSLNGNDIKGWLVYGMNASGKSTLMKATGISILLAQAGCFVPATEMTLKPFKSIYTRILNNDNLFAGLSSFAVEMSELRDILRNATQYTLVLGDELCSGTESISAQALVASGIQWMTKRNAKFIFATHLHDLPTIIDTKAEGVEVLHLHVEYDPLTKKLIYDRTLRPGSGSSLYGLEVARAMDLPFEFIEQALVNRHKLVGSSSQQDAKSSSWNKSIIRKSCEVCKTDIVSELEVHHIKPRESAKNGILEDGTHMNDSRNLIVLCEKCHDEHHAGKLEIGNVVITSDGESRMIQNPVQQQQKQQTKSRKWTDEEIEIVKNIIVKYSSLSLKSIKSHLQAKFGINISESMLSHFKKNNTF